MTAEEIAETYINGNISVAREELKRASKVKVLGVVLALVPMTDPETAIDIVYRLVRP